MWPFRSSPKRLAERGDASGLLKIVTERLTARQQRRSRREYVHSSGDPFAAHEELTLRKSAAADYLRTVLAKQIAQGQSPASSGILGKLNRVAEQLAADKDEDTAKLLALSLYPLRDREADSVLAKLLTSSVGSQVWIDLCRTLDPAVLHSLLPVIPHLSKHDHDMLNPLLDWLKHPVEGADEKGVYPVQFLVPLIFDNTLHYGKQREVCTLVKPLLRGRTPAERILGAMLCDPVDDREIDAVGKEAVPILHKLQQAIETDLSEKATWQLKRLKAPQSLENRVFSLLNSSPVDRDAICALGAQAGGILLRQLTSKSHGHVVAEILARMRYPEAVKPILDYHARAIRSAYTSFVISGRDRDSSRREFRSAAIALGPCAEPVLTALTRDKVEAVREAATEAIADITGATHGHS